MALSLLCGGLGVAEATVHVNEGTGVTSEVYTTGETYNRIEADAKYAMVNDVTANTTEIAGLKTAVGDAGSGLTKAVADQQADIAVNKVNITALQNELGNKADTTALNNKADKADLDTANGEITALKNKTANLSDDGKELKDMTTVSGTTVSGDNVKAGELTVTGEIKDGAGVTTTLAKINDSMTQTATNTGNIANLKTKTDGQQTAIDDLKKKTTKIDYDAANDTTSINGIKVGDQVDMGGKKLTNVGTINGIDIGDAQVDMKGKNLTGVGTINGTEIGMKVDGNYIHQDSSIWGNMNNVDTQVKTNADNIKTNTTAITTLNTKVGEIDDRTGGITRNTKDTQTTIENSVKVDNQGNVKDVKGLSAETITTTGNATIGGDLKVAGTITTDKMVFGDPATNNYTEIDHGKVTSKNLVVNGAGQTISSSSTFDVEKNEVGFTNTATGDHSYYKQTAKGINGYVTDKDGNKTYTKVTATENSFQVQDKDGKNKNHQVNTKDSSVTEITNGDGKTTKTEQTAENITNTAKDGTIKNDAKDIVNNASGNISNKSQTMDTTVTGKATESYGSLDTTVNGNETHIVKGTKMETVDGKVTENYKAGQATNVTGNQDIHVTGKQTNTVEGGQENMISGGQINTITGGQTNNITGDQTTTITGNKNETVTENVTEDYKKNLTTTVGGNEIHEVKGTKTETVEGKLTENFKGGQETNVTGDQTTNVSGTQTTTATDINRNASSSMVDKVDNAYGTNTETKEAGKTTTDVSIKGTGEKGQYIRGANESRDYLIKDTLMNSETKTAEATSTEITDGTNKASTRQDAKNLAGSVTNGTEIGVSGIHANDDGSVSIDSAVAGGGMSSVINQKKDSIQSAVGDGTNSTVIHQDKDNVTIASSNGTVGIVGKDIVNNAQNTITNTAGTSITNQVNDSKVTTDANGTTFENNTPAVSDGGATTTKINGNLITTGRVDANELGVSDKDGANTADLSVKAGEGVKASAGNGTTTGSLDVKADEVVSSVKDADGKGSTFKQRIDAIMMESKDVSIKAEETLTNEAKVITNRASEVINNEAININNTATGIIKSKASEIQNQADKLISNKVGENTWENMENGKITTSIKDGAKQNLTQSDAAGTTQSTVDGGKSTVTIQNADGLADAVTDGTNTSVQNQTASAIAAAVKDGAGNENASVANATTSVNTIKSGSKANTVISTADGTSFINSEAAAPVTGASGAGTHLNTTIKGNTITTGKVTMDYAEVMKDLGVRGNANITGKTTTGSLEVKGESKLTGDVTMESNATVKKDLTVEGNTNLKNTKVDGTLDVTQKANFGDSVSIAKDLSVGGNATIKGDVTASSYKVGDKTYISAAGINANDQKITNVADGSISEGSKDAVNGGQLYTVKNDFEGKVNKVGANAAAMANLHPMEFDPDSKWNIAAAIGNYGSETAAALGAFYRPNDDVMVNLSTAFGTGENMVGGGVSVRLGKGGNKLSREETNALKAQVADLTARMDALLSVLNPNMSKDFPDVPENHWAYEAVSRLAGNDIVQGYPDGEFHGERTMTRYEMAEIIYNALSRGAEAEKELVEEFKPELQAMAASEKATAEKAEG